MGEAGEEDEQKHVMPLQPLFRAHTRQSIHCLLIKQVTWPSPKSMGEDVYSFKWQVLQKVWMNSFIMGGSGVRVVGNNNLVYHNVSRKIALIDMVRQEEQ